MGLIKCLYTPPYEEDQEKLFSGSTFYKQSSNAYYVWFNAIIGAWILTSDYPIVSFYDQENGTQYKFDKQFIDGKIVFRSGTWILRYSIIRDKWILIQDDQAYIPSTAYDEQQGIGYEWYQVGNIQDKQIELQGRSAARGEKKILKMTYGLKGGATVCEKFQKDQKQAFQSVSIDELHVGYNKAQLSGTYGDGRSFDLRNCYACLKVGATNQIYIRSVQDGTAIGTLSESALGNKWTLTTQYGVYTGGKPSIGTATQYTSQNQEHTCSVTISKEEFVQGYETTPCYYGDIAVWG